MPHKAESPSVPSTWSSLNARQQAYLTAIYEVDQENERFEKQGGWEPGMRTRPAAEWRWMEYGIQPATGGDSPLRYRLRVAQLVDPGTGATFGALETRGYIECSYRPVVGGDPLVLIQITRKGRKLVRANLGELRERPLPSGTLRPWHWKAMGALWESRPDGLRDTGHGWYGDTSWKTWRRLQEYRAAPLAETYKTWERETYQSSDRTWGQTVPVYWIRLSEFGEQYYCENWQRYRELYPDVDAPAPTPGSLYEEETEEKGSSEQREAR